LWAAGREYRQGISAASGKPQVDGCLVTVVDSLSLDDNQNCETVAVDDNDNMACSLIASIVGYRPIVLSPFVTVTVNALSRSTSISVRLLVIAANIMLCIDRILTYSRIQYLHLVCA